MSDEKNRPEYITDADWEIITARFERAERWLNNLQDELNTTRAVTIRVDELVHAHQPFIDRVRAEAVGTLLTVEQDSGPVLDGRTFMTLVRWAQYIEQCARPPNAAQKRLLRNTPVTCIVSPGEYEELVAAVANAKTFLEGVRVLG